MESEGMRLNEDFPQDVQDATPVEETVKRGEIDEVSSARAKTAWNETDGEQRFFCKKYQPAIEKVDCCEVKRQKYAASKKQYVKMLVHGNPCEIEKIETIPRECMTKDEHLDFLASPKKSCPTQCAMKEEIRRVRSVSPRIRELARPTKRRLMETLRERGDTMAPWLVENMIDMLEEETALTPEQAERMVRDKANTPKSSSKKKKKPPSKKQCDSEKPAKSPTACGKVGEPCVDLEAANCQYKIALRFVRSIFNWRCCHPRDDYRDIAEVVLERLSETLDYKPIGAEDRKSQQMRILADVYACWIADILMEVSDRHRAELEEECLRKRKEAEEQAAREAAMAAEDYDDDDDQSRSSASLEGESDRLSNADSCTKTVGVETLDADFDDKDLTETGTQYDEEELGDTAEAELECEEKERPKDDEAVKEEKEEDKKQVEEEQQTEGEPKKDEETEIEAGVLKACRSKSEMELDKLACRMSASFSDVPFVTIGMIFDTIYCMIECEAEDTLECPDDKRIHRAIYEKFERFIKCENPDLFTERTKDVLDVISGKIALWVRKTLNEQHIKYMKENPGQVESREVREWNKWIIGMADVGETWSNWIKQMVEESRAMKKRDKVTRGEWQSWTSTFEKNAALYRRAYLEAMHEQHHKIMMITDRKIVKTGGLKKIEFDEKTIKSTRFDTASGCK